MIVIVSHQGDAILAMIGTICVNLIIMCIRTVEIVVLYKIIRIYANFKRYNRSI
jgi:hypothetical protein